MSTDHANPPTSHTSDERDAELCTWYKDERIVEALREAEAPGLSAALCCGDAHLRG